LRLRAKPRPPLRVAAGAAAVALAGCGFGPGATQPGAVTLTIARGFGEHRLDSVRVERVRTSDTVMRLLESHRRVDTRYGGDYVQAIDGLAGSLSARRDWFFYVNGSEAPVGAADYGVHAGDTIEWDYHRWDATMHVPAIVGAYPKPFTRLPSERHPRTIVECGAPAASCATVARRLAADGATVSRAPLAAPPPANAVLVVVAPWKRARTARPLRSLESGPAASGVFARFDAAGRLTLLDGGGRAALAATPGTGLVAATAESGGAPAWMVTGVDDTGVARAARALDTSILRDRFAVAFTPSGALPLPIRGER
jgi:hypothetical protein